MARESLARSEPSDAGLISWIVDALSLLGKGALAAFSPSALLLAFAALAATSAGWSWFSVERVDGSGTWQSLAPPPLPFRTMARQQPPGRPLDETPSPVSAPLSPESWNASAVPRWLSGPLLRAGGWLIQPMERLAWERASVGEKTTLFVASLWTIAVWSLFGAAIARYVAARLVSQMPISAAKALAAAWSHWPSTVLAPLGVWGAIVLMASLGAGCRWLLQFDLLLLAAGVAWPLALLFGLTLLFLLGGVTMGWPLMTTSSAIEQGDAFDQVGRAFAYLYQRPLQLAALFAMATALGVLCEIALWSVVEGTIRTTHGMMLGDRDLLDGETWGLSAVRFWGAAAYRLAESFALAYLASASVAIYLMLRRAVDDVEIDE